MQSSMLKAIVEDFGNGGTIDGDVVITGDLQVDGGGSLSFDEIIEGTQVIDVTSTEAFLVRKDGDGGDIFVVDSTNGNIGIGTAPAADSRLHLYSATHGTDLVMKWQAENDAGTVIPFYMRLNPDADTFALFGDVDNSLVINQTSGKVGIGTASPSYPLHVTTSSRPTLGLTSTDAGADPGPIIYLERHSGSPADGDNIGSVYFQAFNDAAESTTFARMRGLMVDASNGDEEGGIRFDTTLGGVTSGEAMRIVGGNVGIGSFIQELVLFILVTAPLELELRVLRQQVNCTLNPIKLR